MKQNKCSPRNRIFCSIILNIFCGSLGFNQKYLLLEMVQVCIRTVDPNLRSISSTIWTHFFANILVPKNFKPKTQLCNFWQQKFVQKMPRENVDEIHNWGTYQETLCSFNLCFLLKWSHKGWEPLYWRIWWSLTWFRCQILG